MGRYPLILLLIAFTACSSESDHPIVGTWKLMSMMEEGPSGEWQPYAGGMQGYIMYNADGHMALHLSYEGYEDTDLSIDNFDPYQARENLEYLTGTYHYIAEYSIEKQSSPIDGEAGIVTHKRIAHSNPNDWGAVVKREFEVYNDLLTIVPLEEENSRILLSFMRVD